MIFSNYIKKLSILLFILFITGYSDDIYGKVDSAKKDLKKKISWENVKGAIKYKVVIVNSKNRVIIKQVVNSNNFELSISPGKYKIRIGSINKFHKLVGWSDWAHIEIKRADSAKKVKLKAKEKAKAKAKARVEKKKEASSPTGIKFSLGISCFQILNNWNEVYEDACPGYIINIGYSLKYIDYLRSFWMLKNIDIELEVNHASFKGKNRPDKVESDMNNLFVGGNIQIATNFNSQLNFAIRVGSGLMFTELLYKEYDFTGSQRGTERLNSQDPSFKIGLSAEYRFFSPFFLEMGIDEYIILFSSKNFHGLKYFCLIGMRL